MTKIYVVTIIASFLAGFLFRYWWMEYSTNRLVVFGVLFLIILINEKTQMFERWFRKLLYKILN